MNTVRVIDHEAALAPRLILKLLRDIQPFRLQTLMLGINNELHSMMGWQVLLPMFAAAILGGVGRVEGAVLGGLIVGIAEEMSIFILPAQYKAATAFVLLLLILLVRPRGLLNGKVL